MSGHNDNIRRLRKKFREYQNIVDSYSVYKLPSGNNPNGKENICWYDGHPFNWDSVGLPIMRKKKREGDKNIYMYTEIGCFCSFACKKAYLFDKAFFKNSVSRINEYITDQFITYHRLKERQDTKDNLKLYNSYYTPSKLNRDGMNVINRKNTLVLKNILLKSDGVKSTFTSIPVAPPRELLLTGDMCIEKFRKTGNCKCGDDTKCKLTKEDKNENSLYVLNMPPSIGSWLTIEKFNNTKNDTDSKISQDIELMIPEKSTVTNEVKPTTQTRKRGPGKAAGRKRKVNNNIISTLNIVRK